MASSEAGYHEDYKRHLVDAAAADTVETTLFDGGWPNAPHRVLRNRVVESWEEAGRPRSGARPGEGEQIGLSPDEKPILRYSIASLLQGAPGSIDDFAVYAGQSVGLVNDILPASQIVRRMIDQAVRTIAERTSVE